MATEKRLIDVNKPIMETESIINFRMCHHMPIEDYESFLNYLKKQPIVDAVEVVHGNWIENEYVDELYGGYYLFHCSECGIPNAMERNYCPNCGADMRERKDND